MGTPNQLTHTDSHEVDDRGVRLPIADKAALADSIPTTPRRRLWGRIFRVARAIFVVIMLLMAFRNMTANVDWPYLVIGGAVFASIALLAHLGRYAKPIGPPEKSDRGSISFPAMIVAGAVGNQVGEHSLNRMREEWFRVAFKIMMTVMAARLLWVAAKDYGLV